MYFKLLVLEMEPHKKHILLAHFHMIQEIPLLSEPCTQPEVKPANCLLWTTNKPQGVSTEVLNMEMFDFCWINDFNDSW